MIPSRPPSVKPARGKLTTQANATISTAFSVPQGYLGLVAVQAGTGQPHGRLYGVAVLQDENGANRGCIWRGYILGAETPVSVPGNYVPSGWSVLLEVAANSQGGGVACSADVYVQDTPTGASFIFNEAPGSGRGDLVILALANPGAGLDYPVQVIGAKETDRLLSWSARLVTDATAPTREPSINIDSGPGTPVYARGQTANAQAASLTKDYGFKLGNGQALGSTNQNQSGDLADVRMDTGDRIASTTLNKGAADQWSNHSAELESWAVL